MDGSEGNVVDRQAFKDQLIDLLFRFSSAEMTVPMMVTSPDLSAVDVEPALAKAQIMVSSDVVLTSKGETLATLTPNDIANYLDVDTSGEAAPEARPYLSPEKMVTLFDSIEEKVGTPGVDATFEMNLEGAEPYPLVLVEGKDGEGLDREGTAEALTRAAMVSTGRTAEVALKAVPPDLTTEEVEAMGIKDLLGDYKTTPYTGTKNRQINVRLATKLCSGIFLAPGEEFNTDQRLGARDAAHGWATAPGIVGPGQLEDVYGGGICQVSTTLFNAVLQSGLDITKRYNHSIFINHYPDGRDATVTAGGKNMSFRNDTDHYVFIYGWSTGINTRFWIWGVDDGREVLPITFSGYSYGTRFTTETVLNNSLNPGQKKEIFTGQTARRCSISRTIVFGDGRRETEVFSSYYPMMPKVIETGPPLPTTTAVTAPTGTTVGP